MIIKNRLKENIPIIKCLTCGKRALQASVIELEDPALIKDMRYKKRKTWARIMKPSFNVYYNGMRKLRNKRIFYAAMLQGCINKRHKLRVQFLNKIKFPTSYPDQTPFSEREEKEK
jgi:hypothetical protein